MLCAVMQTQGEGRLLHGRLGLTEAVTFLLVWSIRVFPVCGLHWLLGSWGCSEEWACPQPTLRGGS